MATSESSEETLRGLSVTETKALHKKMTRVRALMVESEARLSRQEAEITELKRQLEARHSKMLDAASVTPQDFRDIVEAKLLAIREEIDKLTTIEEGKIPESSPLPPGISSVPLRTGASGTHMPPKEVKIYVDGCWDVMHSGHYNALRQSKALGDYLIVGVHSDAEIERNKRKPVFNDLERMAMVNACKWTDEVVFDVPYSPSVALLDKVDADFCAHGDDLPIDAEGNCAYGDVSESKRLKIFKRTPGVSTTMLISRLCHAVEAEAAACSKPSVEASADGSTEAVSWSSFLATSHRVSAFSNHRLPAAGDIVVYIDGIWDLFHPGHVAALKKARELGDFLYVGVYDDACVRMHKGYCWPMMNLQERILNVLSCRYVDEVVVGCPWIVGKDTLTVLNVHVVAYAEHVLLHPEDMARYAHPNDIGALHKLEPATLDSTLSTMQVVKRIVSRHDEIKTQNEARIKRELKYTEERTYIEEVS